MQSDCTWLEVDVALPSCTMMDSVMLRLYIESRVGAVHASLYITAW